MLKRPRYPVKWKSYAEWNFCPRIASGFPRCSGCRFSPVLSREPQKVPRLPTLPRSWKIDRLFDRFYRMDESRSSATGGTGIGLSMVRSIAETHAFHTDFSPPAVDMHLNLTAVIRIPDRVIQ